MSKKSAEVICSIAALEFLGAVAIMFFLGYSGAWASMPEWLKFAVGSILCGILVFTIPISKVPASNSWNPKSIWGDRKAAVLHGYR